MYLYGVYGHDGKLIRVTGSVKDESVDSHKKTYILSEGVDRLTGLYDTDGSIGAAKGAGMGAHLYNDHNEAFASLQKIRVIEPKASDMPAYDEAYQRWKSYVQ